MELDVAARRHARRVAVAPGGIAHMPSKQAPIDADLRRAPQNERTARRELEQRLNEALKRLEDHEVMAREVDHRMKNSLQLVASMLTLQARQVADDPAGRVLDAARQRVLSIAAVHEQLYRCHTPDSIGLREFLQGLGDALVLNKPDNVTNLTMQTAPIAVPADFAKRLGLLVCEFVINAFKHAYPANSRGPVRVQLDRTGDGYRLLVEDDGVGVSPDLDTDTGGFGTLLIKSIVSQLGGAIKMGADPGCRVIVDIPALVGPHQPSHN